MDAREIRTRILAALIGGPVVLIMAYFGRSFFVLIMNIIIGFSVWEFYQFAEKRGYAPSRITGTGLVLLFSWFLALFRGRFVLLALLAVVLIVLIEALFKAQRNPLINASITLLGFLYISLFNAFVFLREAGSPLYWNYATGGWLVISIFISIWICDSTAYFFGSRFGKHLLFKRVSPAKTWEGALAGLLAALITASLLLSRLSGFNWIDGIVFGLIIGVAGPVSDLVESLFKRDAGVKDSSSLIPGHGGMLDRFDSPLFIGPLILLYLLATRII